MRMSDGVEWAIHCCTVLAALPDGQALPAAKLAEFHDVPPAYLAKHLQADRGRRHRRVDAPGRGAATASAGRPPRSPCSTSCWPSTATSTAFRCSEIRQRGPVACPPDAYRRPCGIARAMWRAEDAWRAELRPPPIADLVVELLGHRAARGLQAGAEWLQAVEIGGRPTVAHGQERR